MVQSNVFIDSQQLEKISVSSCCCYKFVVISFRHGATIPGHSTLQHLVTVHYGTRPQYITVPGQSTLHSQYLVTVHYSTRLRYIIVPLPGQCTLHYTATAHYSTRPYYITYLATVHCNTSGNSTL